MKISYEWLGEFVRLTLPPEELAERLTMAGLEVKGLERAGTDWIFEIEITSNRPDWLSVCGVAREVSALTGEPLRFGAPGRPLAKTARAGKPLRLAIESVRDCPFYSAQVFLDAKVCPAPSWMQERLERIGCRSINNIVDITNYILFGLGAPLHAFDAAALGTDTIAVRRARPGERLTTIDGQERALGPEILVIADRARPVAVAGVMGGRQTEITAATTALVLEAAVFNPALVRCGRQRLGMNSDASYRFERGVAVETARWAAGLAAGLLCRWAGARLASCSLTPLRHRRGRSIPVSTQHVDQALGVAVARAQTQRILQRLGFAVRGAGKNMRVRVPAFRLDVSQEADIIEEVARIYGYERIPTTIPATRPRLLPQGIRPAVSRTKQLLAGLGLTEAITVSLVDKKSLAGLWPDGETLLEVQNPLSAEQEVLRPILAPGLLRSIRANLNQQQSFVGLFEIARTFFVRQRRCVEELHLGIALCGQKCFFSPRGAMREPASVLHLKGILEELFRHLGVREYAFSFDQMQPQAAILVQGGAIGSMRAVSPEVLAAYAIKAQQVFLAELNLQPLLGAAAAVRFQPLPRFPAIQRDLTLCVAESVSAQEMIRELMGERVALLRQARLTDHFAGGWVPAGMRALTFSLEFRSSERTLTEDEITPLCQQVQAFLTHRFGAQVRTERPT